MTITTDWTVRALRRGTVNIIDCGKGLCIRFRGRNVALPEDVFLDLLEAGVIEREAGTWRVVRQRR